MLYSRFFLQCSVILLALMGVVTLLPGQEPAQIATADTSIVYEMVDSKLQTKPSFPGGEELFYKYLAKNLAYPKEARKNRVQGVVALTFVVAEDGSIQNVVVLKDIGKGCGEESVRVIKSMPNWIPGMANGKPVKVRYIAPIRFKLT